MKIPLDLMPLNNEELWAVFCHLALDDTGELQAHSLHLYRMLVDALHVEILARHNRTGIHAGAFEISFDGLGSADVGEAMLEMGNWLACMAPGLTKYRGIADLFRVLSIELGKAHQAYVASVGAAEAVINDSPAPPPKAIPSKYRAQRNRWRRLAKQGIFG